ncbi:MAG: type II toxin-antitoxin system HicA family toxin [Syntrophales bacterium]|nr:type II toxin-antitoxin system HicA family toxin [Syntrophales bacterium]
MRHDETSKGIETDADQRWSFFCKGLWRRGSCPALAYKKGAQSAREIQSKDCCLVRENAVNFALGQQRMSDMATKHKILQKILAGSKNIRFSDMIELVEGFGFRLSRTDGSHHIFAHPDIPELVNLQEVKGQAKPYQMRQFLKLIERHSLRLEEDK